MNHDGISYIFCSIKYLDQSRTHCVKLQDMLKFYRLIYIRYISSRSIIYLWKLSMLKLSIPEGIHVYIHHCLPPIPVMAIISVRPSVPPVAVSVARIPPVSVTGVVSAVVAVSAPASPVRCGRLKVFLFWCF